MAMTVFKSFGLIENVYSNHYHLPTVHMKCYDFYVHCYWCIIIFSIFFYFEILIL